MTADNATGIFEPGDEMRTTLMIVACLGVLQACGPADDCSDMVGTWQGRPGTVVVRQTGKSFTVEFPATSRSLDMECKNATLSGSSPIRGSRNAAGKLVLDGFPGGVIETFAKAD
jgi:hypothetical protein